MQHGCLSSELRQCSSLLKKKFVFNRCHSIAQRHLCLRCLLGATMKHEQRQVPIHSKHPRLSTVSTVCCAIGLSATTSVLITHEEAARFAVRRLGQHKFDASSLNVRDSSRIEACLEALSERHRNVDGDGSLKLCGQHSEWEIIARAAHRTRLLFRRWRLCDARLSVRALRLSQ